MKKKIFFIIFFLMFIFLLYGDEIIDKIEKHYKNGNLYYEQGKYYEAEKEYKKALKFIEEYKAKTVKEKISKDKIEKIELKKEQKKIDWQYTIGNEDILFLSVWQNPDLDQELIIRPDGYVSVPLIGDVKAGGLTIPELDKIITEKLKDYIRQPEVSITIKKIGGNKVILLGEINLPGVYNVNAGTRVMELIGLGKDFTKDAVKTSVILIRGGFSNPLVRRLNLESVLKGDLTDNIILEAEDIVFIPRTFISNLNYFMKQLLEPLSKGAVAHKEIQSFR